MLVVFMSSRASAKREAWDSYSVSYRETAAYGSPPSRGRQSSSAPVLVVNFREEVILPRRRLHLERADARHEVGVLHGVLRHDGPMHLCAGDDLSRRVERQLRLRILDPVLGGLALVLVDDLGRFLQCRDKGLVPVSYTHLR